uniref:Uncharacterized protein n=1 Tax=Megaselia scalaris TaxID=36166 RepID=T1GXU7_MEGSC
MNIMPPSSMPEVDTAGSTEDWSGFEASYSKSTGAYKYSDLENSFRLIEALKGPAKEAVDGLLIHPENVNEVMKKLRFEFRRSDLIVKCQHEKIMKLPAIDESDLSL